MKILRMKKVLFFIHDLGPGGAEKVLVNLVNNLNPEKYDITVQTLFDEGVHRDSLKSHVRYIPGGKRSFRGNTTLMKCFPAALLWKQLVKEHQLDSLTALSSLSLLKELDLSGCRFPADELKTIAGLPALEKLSLSRCSLSTIADLAGAMNLKVLDLSNNTLRNLEPLIPMTTLEEVNLQHNAVTSLDALMALTNLKKLDLSYNSITNVSPLQGLAALQSLNLCNNQVKDVQPISKLGNLTSLNLSHNKISSATSLSACKKLVELNISNNSVSSIYTFHQLTALETLNITENRYSGIPTIRREMREAGLPMPQFEDNRGSFRVTLLGERTEIVKKSIEADDILAFCMVPRSREELANFLGIKSVPYAIIWY